MEPDGSLSATVWCAFSGKGRKEKKGFGRRTGKTESNGETYFYM